MIQILTFLISKLGLTDVFSFIKKHIKTIAVFILAIFVAIFCLMFNKLKVKDAEIGRLNNNYLYYQELNQNNSENNRILQLTIDDFKQSRDSLINVIRDTQKELKIKDKDLISAYAWMSLAATGNDSYDPHPTAARERDELEKLLKPQQVLKAQQLAASWEYGKSLQIVDSDSVALCDARKCRIQKVNLRISKEFSQYTLLNY